MNPLADALSEHQRRAADPRSLADSWRATWEAATEAWPEVAVPPQAFAALLVSRLPPGDGDPLASIEALRTSELYLVCGCLRGQHDALREFERRYGHELAAAARGVGSRQPEEVVQRLRVRLLVGPDPRLARYAGAGSLKRWLKIACKRLAIDLGRSASARGRAEDRGQFAERLTGADPELQLLKTRYRAAFQRAFEAAMRDLTPAARTMLRLHLINRLTIDEIAPLHGIHRATAARRLARARAEVLDGCRARLRELLATDDHDVESILRLISSHIDVSIARHLETRADV